MTNTQVAELLRKLAAEISKPQVKDQAGKQAHKPVKSPKSPVGLSKRDAATIRAFARKGIKDVVLMDRSDAKKPFNVRPFKAWVEVGRVVVKGQHGVHGLFHISQTKPLGA